MYLEFPVPVENLEAPVSPEGFGAFEAAFAPLRERRAEVYSRIPGGETWPEFDPPREKLLEYYLTLQAFRFRPGFRYLDVASCLSLFPNFVAETTGATVLRQDLFYTPGQTKVAFPRLTAGAQGTVDIECLGGDACALPLKDESVDGIALHCSFEHFEGDGDIRLVTEALRVLRRGGGLLIIPFYCGDKYQEIRQEHFAEGCRFHRYYDPSTFASRVLSPQKVQHHLEMRYYRGSRQMDSSFYCDYSIKIIKGSRPWTLRRIKRAVKGVAKRLLGRAGRGR